MNSERLSFAALAPRHAERLFEPLQDPLVYRYIPEDPPASIEALTTRYARLAAGSTNAREIWRNWIMFTRAGDEPVGTLQATVRPKRPALIGYVVVPCFWGLGLATEGVAWMLQELAEVERVSWVEACIDTRNRASIQLVERLGFCHVRTIVDADRFKGRSSDEFVFQKAIGTQGSD